MLIWFMDWIIASFPERKNLKKCLSVFFGLWYNSMFERSVAMADQERWIPTEQQLVMSIGHACLMRGDILEKNRKIVYYEEVSRQDRTSLLARVYDSGTLQGVQVDFLYTQRIEFRCGCEECRQPQRHIMCRHGSAVVLHYIREGHQGAQRGTEETDLKGRALIDRFLQETHTFPAPASGEHVGESLHLEARVTFDPARKGTDAKGMACFPRVSLQIGKPDGRMYRVRSIPALLEDFRNQECRTYGKNCSLVHDERALDPESLELYRIIREQVSADADAVAVYMSFSSLSNYIQDSVRLRGQYFDRIFELYQGRGILAGKDGQESAFSASNPSLHLVVQRAGDQIVLDMADFQDMMFFRTGQYQYVRMERDAMIWIDRVSDEFYRAMQPMEGLLLDREVHIQPVQMTSFCSAVLPVIRPYTEIMDPDEVLSEFMPDVCIAEFYLDQLQDHGLACRLKFRYDQMTLEYDETEIQDIQGMRRDVAVERRTAGFLHQYFFFQSAERVFVIYDRDDADSFLIDHIEALRALGEVYISDSIRNREVRPSEVSVSLSINHGILFMDFDTGKFPAAELEALYQSLLLRKKYHRLKDGRYVVLGHGNLEVMAEIAHMTQLGAGALAQGHAEMPAYRALYLDSVLRQADGIRRLRDTSFRDMVRRFRTVTDSDEPVPEAFTEVLRPYQETGFRWLKALETSHFGGILADEMGLGKTLQMIVFLSTCKHAMVGKPSLVVCPASLILNWADEFGKFAPDMHTVLIMGNAPARKALIETSLDADVWITSYDLLKRDISLYHDTEFYTCVLDEAQYVKNQNTLVSRAVKSIVCEQRFVMTGTPVENRLSELWNMFDFLMPGYLFSHTRFTEKLERPIMENANEEAGVQLQRLVRPFILRRLKQEVLHELPPKEEFVRRIELSEDEEKVYAASVAAAKASLQSSGEKLQILAALTRLRQVCCDPVLCFENYTGETSKLEACLELVSSMVENHHQVLLFSQFASMLSILEARISELGISCRVLQGSTTKEKRAELVRTFNAGRFQVFLISLKAGGTGLNLTAADVVIHYDPWWNIAAQNQATDRAHRIGQQQKVQVYKLITRNTIEEKIMTLQTKKAELLECVTETNGTGILGMTSEDLLALLDR